MRYYKSAQELLLPVNPIDEIHGFELILHKQHYYFYGGETPNNRATSARLARGKYFTNQTLKKAGIPVPQAVLLSKQEFIEHKISRVLSSLKFPMVIKPLDKSEGTGVLCNIQSPNELEEMLIEHFHSYNLAIIEEFHGNLKSYRVLVFNQRVIGIVLRHPSQVVGDGTHNIKELCELTNDARKKLNPYLGLINLGHEAQIRLKELGINEHHIPEDKEHVVLGYTSNATRGGTFETVDQRIGKENRKLMVRVAQTLGLNLVGIDVQCADLQSPIQHSNGVILEANEVPSIRIHELPMKGRPQMVTRKIMRSFIYQHPFAYLYSLYFNKRTGFYVRCFIIVLIIAVLYMLIA